MKHIIISISLVLTALLSPAQTKSETSDHLVFKGVPIDGTLSEYTLKMQNSGFTHIQTKDGIALLKGDFAAFKNCVIGVATQKQKDLVSKITVMFPEQVTEKYGEPKESVEKFDVQFEPKDDGS
jgi:hypothetical protein